MPMFFSLSTETWETQESANLPNLRAARTNLKEEQYVGKGVKHYVTFLLVSKAFKVCFILFASQVDKFSIEGVDLGQVFKIRIRHDNSMIGADWYLDQVEVLDVETEEVYMFLCERWLSTKKEDKRIERTFYVKVGKESHIFIVDPILFITQVHV